MEQKSIGRFIALLRKESGLTQKQLAEKLNVSDKTVSHWERDESSPDLSVIPLIADIFGVTCDELIRGKRDKNFSYGEDKSLRIEENTGFAVKKSYNAFKIKAFISIGLSVVGILIGMILFYKLEFQIGFLISVCFNVVSLILAVIFYLIYSFSLKNSEHLESGIKIKYIKKGNSVTIRIIYFVIIMLAFSVSFVQCGTYLDGLFNIGFIYSCGAAIALIVIDIVLRSLGVFYKKQRTLQEKKIYYFSAITFSVLAAVLISTGIFQYIAMTQTARLSDVMSMLRYVLYPLEVVIAFSVYAIGMKMLKKK